MGNIQLPTSYQLSKAKSLFNQTNVLSPHGRLNAQLESTTSLQNDGTSAVYWRRQNASHSLVSTYADRFTLFDGMLVQP